MAAPAITGAVAKASIELQIAAFGQAKAKPLRGRAT
jgi:hypothetical protein